MKNIVIQFNRMDAAIAVLREVASWGREQGYRVWPDEWLTEEALITTDAGPENFCVGLIDGEIAFCKKYGDTYSVKLLQVEREKINLS